MANENDLEAQWIVGEDSPPDQLILDLDGFEGPLDVLLSLAREQKVDLVHISILALANQYIDYIARAHFMCLEIAADYLVMAAWLAYLKSRLLLPQQNDEEEPGGPELAAALAFHLQRYNAMKEAGLRLKERPQKGRDFFPCGAPEGLRNIRRSIIDVSLFELLTAYGNLQQRDDDQTLHIASIMVYSMDDVLQRFVGMLGKSPGWRSLMDYLPEALDGELMTRSAVAATFSAGLELAKQGRAQLRQKDSFDPLYLRAVKNTKAGGDDSKGDES